MPVLLVAEVVVDTFLFQEPAHEAVVGLVVLHAVLAHGVPPLERGVIEVCEAQLAEDLLDDVGDRLVLEDPAVHRPREEPQPRPQGGAIVRAVAVIAHVAELADVSVEEARTVVGQSHPHGELLAEHVLELELVVIAEQVDVVLEQTT